MDKEKIGKVKAILQTKIILLSKGHNIETTDEYSRLKLKMDYETILNYIQQLENKLKIKEGDIIYLTNELNKSISKNEIQKKINELNKLNVNLPVEHMKQAQIKILKELIEDKE